ncbi:predicted protein [Chaetomium globosum CBS 148.51]|uniref:Uncharacterized protein n=1 Tax=Chaetomium globosum (strain ATCC 6205 / CBS 148.51 / DSM 1962 / NBRC 6347 / NRRL 1970) TaxID=306901 RepID=Q2HI70_CHAGB|nr:uncharacterized protein CHGG_00084 [Chaetomium globosum CBS 148.51]EAQ91849.1 predicted protein [Chaetomium globosum CBS 148.51]
MMQAEHSPNSRVTFSAQRRVLRLLWRLWQASEGSCAASLRHIALYARRWFVEKRRVHVKEFRRAARAANPDAGSHPQVRMCDMAVVKSFGIAAVSLTFQAEPGIQEIYPDSAIGDVAIPDMTRFARVGRFNDGARPQSLAAHILGDTATSFEYSTLPSDVMTDAPIARYPYAFWDAGNHWEFVFVNSAPVPGSQDFNFLSLYSDQHVQSSAICQTPRYTYNLSAGILSIQQTTTTTNTTTKTILFPASGVGDEAITYLTTPVLHDTGANSTGTCGPGCATIHVVEPHAGPAVTDSTFVHPTSSFFYYECNITVQPTTQPNAGPFSLFPTTAAVAAQAIALSGQRAPPSDGDASPFGLNQFASYNLGLEFGQAQNNNATAMGRMLSRFALGVVAAAARTNPKVVVQGRPPRQGVRLVLDKPVVFGAILIATAAVQLVLLGAVIVLVRGLRKDGRRDGGGRGDVEFTDPPEQELPFKVRTSER